MATPRSEPHTVYHLYNLLPMRQNPARHINRQSPPEKALLPSLQDTLPGLATCEAFLKFQSDHITPLFKGHQVPPPPMVCKRKATLLNTAHRPFRICSHQPHSAGQGLSYRMTCSSPKSFCSVFLHLGNNYFFVILILAALFFVTYLGC